MTATAPPAPPAHHYRPTDFYRDSWSHLSARQRAELRREYRHLRRLGVDRNLAKGALYRTVNIVRDWD